MRPGQPAAAWRGGYRKLRFIEQNAGVADITQSFFWVFPEAMCNQVAYARRSVGGQRGVIGFARQDGGQRIGDVAAVAEQHFAGEQFVEDCAEGPYIGAPAICPA